jgi:hypothetical protein
MTNLIITRTGIELKNIKTMIIKDYSNGVILNRV